MSLKRIENYQNMNLTKVLKGNGPHKTKHQAVTVMLYRLVIDSVVLIFHYFARHLNFVDVAKYFPHVIYKNSLLCVCFINAIVYVIASIYLHIHYI